MQTMDKQISKIYSVGGSDMCYGKNEVELGGQCVYVCV